MMLLLGCTSGAAPVSAPTTARELEPPSESPVDETPAVVATGPAPVIAPSVDPVTLPPRARVLATLARTFADAGVHHFSQRCPLEFEGCTSVGRDAEGAFMCDDPADGPPSCVAVPFDSIDADPPRFGRGYIDGQFFSDGGSQSFIVRYDVTTETATGSMLDEPETSVALPPRTVPAWVQALFGVEVLGSPRDGYLARTVDHLTFCDLASDVCTRPILVDALDETSIGTLVVGSGRGSGMWQFTSSTGGQLGDLYEVVTSALFVRVDGSVATPVFDLVTGVERRARVTLESDDIEVFEMQHYAHLETDSCVTIQPPGHRHRIERADGRVRRIPVRLRRAPNVLPGASGPADPDSTDLSGAWEIRPGGGLVRVPECVFE
jgi:hypothetical protein